jgi:hypothetical protein
MNCQFSWLFALSLHAYEYIRQTNELKNNLNLNNMKQLFKFTMAMLWFSTLFTGQSNAQGTSIEYPVAPKEATQSNETTPTQKDSKDSYTVTYSILSGSGYLSAYANESYIASGSMIEQNSDIYFEAYPNFGQRLSAWYVNGTLVENNVDHFFTYYNLQANLDVSVEFVEYEFPQIIPDYQIYGISNMEDVDFEIVWGSETGIERIVLNLWDDETYEQTEVILTEGIDYVIQENTLSIKSEFMQSLDPEPFSDYSFMAVFTSYYTVWFGIAVLPNANPHLTPDVLTYDLSNPGSVFTNIIYILADSISTVSVSGNMLTPEQDYSITGGWLFFNNSFLSTQLQAPGDALGVSVVFNTMDVAQVSITTVQTGITNAVISPNEFELVEHDMPDYIDMQITWNDATSVTGMVVSMNSGFGLEEFEWDAYTITDNGNGTASLRLYLGGDKLATLKERDEKGGTETYYVLVDVSFDQGNSAPVFLTIIYEYYFVNAMVVPEYSGWVNGAYSYSPGEEVYLEASPSWGYSFVQWETTEGVVLGTDSFYSFKMPANDVDIVARFQESINIYFDVMGNYYGKLQATHNGVPLSWGDAVPEGASVTFTAQPFPGYMVYYWLVNYEMVSGYTSNILTIDNIQTSQSVQVAFTEIPANQHLVMYNVIGAGGTLAASSGTTDIFSGIALQNASSVTFTALPSSNMRVKRWKNNGVIVQGNVSTTYSIANLNTSVHVTVEFEQITAIDEPQNASMVVYPNPMSDQLFFNTDKDIRRISVVNMLGQTVLEMNTVTDNVVDVQNLSEGFYLIVFETMDAERIVQRVVKSAK